MYLLSLHRKQPLTLTVSNEWRQACGTLMGGGGGVVELQERVMINRIRVVIVSLLQDGFFRF